MKIPSFGPYIARHLDSFVLKDTSLVIDGQNFMFQCYSESKLPFAFGAESDKFADYLRQYLQKFKLANVKCYFIFKGGHKLLSKFKGAIANDRLEAANFVPGTRPASQNIVLPIFMKEIYKQVLDEMGFQYSISTLEAKEDCVALAHQLNCPILSYDIEFCLFGVPYIPIRGMEFDGRDKAIKCGIFHLTNFLDKFRINEEKLALFLVLLDESIFERDFFACFMRSADITYSSNRFDTFRSVLFWLSRTPKKQAVAKIFQFIDDVSKGKFLDEIKHVGGLINQMKASSITARYLEDESAAHVERNDPEWFQKGVCMNYIPISYINLYRWKYFFGSWAIEDLEEDALLFCKDIIKYAFDLLNNFKKEEITFLYKDSKELLIKTSVKKPNYEAIDSVFENGWAELRELKLFEHFLKESFGELDLTCLDDVSDNVKLLMIALVYISIKKNSVQKEVFCVLLSFVMLGVVSKKIRGSEVSADAVTLKDCEAAASVMDEFFKLTPAEEMQIFDRKTLHPLVEFQHCLHQLNFLNTLCGNSFKPTLYGETYNGTFVYKILYAMMHHDGDSMDFVESLLKVAPTVLKYFKKLVQIHGQIIHQ